MMRAARSSVSTVSVCGLRARKRLSSTNSAAPERKPMSDRFKCRAVGLIAVHAQAA
jgi:hypothetical protein